MSIRRLINPPRLFAALIVIVAAAALSTGALADNQGDKSSDNGHKHHSARQASKTSTDRSTRTDSSGKTAPTDSRRNATVYSQDRSARTDSRSWSQHTDSSGKTAPADSRRNATVYSQDRSARTDSRSWSQHTDSSGKTAPADSRRNATVYSQDRAARTDSRSWSQRTDSRGTSGTTDSNTRATVNPRNRSSRTDAQSGGSVNRTPRGPSVQGNGGYRRTETLRPPTPARNHSVNRQPNHVVSRHPSYRAPVLRAGGYYYDSRPRPYHYGHWVFNGNDRDHARRSAYFYFGFFPYVNVDRVYVEPYAAVGYVGGPIVIGGSYYLDRHSSAALDDALSDIRTAWTDGRLDLIERHVDPDRNLAVLLDGRYDYSVSGDDYVQMTSDAIDQLNTTSFTWSRVRERADGDYTAFGRQTYIDASGSRKTVYVSYTLSRSDGDYIIVEVGSSDSRLD